jgi:hypothetical protein
MAALTRGMIGTKDKNMKRLLMTAAALLAGAAQAQHAEFQGPGFTTFQGKPEDPACHDSSLYQSRITCEHDGPRTIRTAHDAEGRIIATTIFENGEITIRDSNGRITGYLPPLWATWNNDGTITLRNREGTLSLPGARWKEESK